MPASGFTVDDKAWIAGLKLYAEATGKDMSDVLNHAAGNAAFRAIGKTKKARVSRTKMAKRWDPQNRPVQVPTRFWYAKNTLDGKPTSNQVVWSRYRRAKSSIGYIKAGFVEPAKDFGKKVRVRAFPRGDAARGKGVKSKPSTHLATVENFADGAETVGEDGMRAALPIVINDMVRYAVRRMERTAKRYSSA